MWQETSREHLSCGDGGMLRERSKFEKHQQVTGKPWAKWEVSKEGTTEDSVLTDLDTWGKWDALAESR